MNIIGFDPSLRQTGYAIVDAEKQKIITAGVIKTNSEKDLNERIFEIFRNAGEILEKHNVSHSAFEESFYHKNVRTSNILSQVRTALIISCMERGLTISVFSPNNIKKCVTGRGHASKEQVLYMIKQIFKITEDVPDDVSDALAIAYTFLARS
ncbi:MAG: crossover junction endodeoxyribonuclease RuvC [bacterium]